MTALIAHTNHVDLAGITAGSEETTLPIANVQSVHLSSKWRTAAGTVSSHASADFGSSKAVGVLFLGGTNLTASATIRLRASDTDSTAVSGDLFDSTSISAAVNDNYGAVYYVLSSAVTARFWRVDITDNALATDPDYLEIGRIFLGPIWQPSRGITYGWSAACVDPSSRSRSRGGQVFVDVRPKFRVLDLEVAFLSEAEIYANAFEIDRANGVNKDILVIPIVGGSHVSEQAVFGLVSQTTPIVNPSFNLFRKRYRVEERL